MTKQIPPLRPLQAFEAVGRVGSVTAAAEELGVTPGAVSQLLRILESQLGVRLYRREGRTLRMTEQARLYFENVTEGFERLRDAGRILERNQRLSLLTVSALPSLAVRWLAPRLFAWAQAHPKIDIRLESTHHESPLESDGPDFRITYGRRAMVHENSRELFRDAVVACCSPAFLASNGPFDTLRAIARAKLIEIDWRPDHSNGATWMAWFRSLGRNGPAVSSRPTYVYSSLAIDSAIAGEGIVLGQLSFIAGDLATGRLVQVHPKLLPVAEPYFLAWSGQALRKSGGPELLDWLDTEASDARRLAPYMPAPGSGLR